MAEQDDCSTATSGPGYPILEDRNVIFGIRENGDRDIFFAAAQMSRMPMCLSDPHRPDAPIIFCNQAFERLVGYGRDEILGRNCRFLQGEGTDPEAVEEIRRALATDREVHIELLNYRKDGSAFWNALFISPVINAAGELLYHFASQLDVTRRREGEAALQQSQRMETLGSMASSLAHEFNNLMTIVLGNLERLAREVSSPAGRKSIERATWGAQRAAKLTDQMLSFARRQFHDDQTIDINATIANCDSILDQMAGLDVTVRLDLAGEAMVASVDPSQLEMALLNLIRNAADATSRGGEIVVATRSRRYDGPDSGPAIEISVADTGSGMTAAVAERAMEPFYTTKAIGKGTGLGMSMVKGFAEQSNGKLELQTAEGVGTTVRLVFPEARSTASG